MGHRTTPHRTTPLEHAVLDLLKVAPAIGGMTPGEVEHQLVQQGHAVGRKAVLAAMESLRVAGLLQLDSTGYALTPEAAS